MGSILSTTFTVSLDDSIAFARLSGDYNPLHVDPIAARRTQFGGTVTHGIHLFLRVLDELARLGLFDQQEPAALVAAFSSPVVTGTPVAVGANKEGAKVRVWAEAAGQAAFNGTLELIASRTAAMAIEDAEFAPMRPQEADFPPALLEDAVPVRLSRMQLRALFPSLADVGGYWIADLLASTHIIGMRCPGMHSIYSGFRLHRRKETDSARTTMPFRLNGVEKRLRLVRLEVTGVHLAGTIEAFFRPLPVAQRPMKDIAACVPLDAFVGHRALIIGGSRGLGELAAKIVAAGGAEVTITYARGKEDAERICAEADALGRHCTAHHMDIAQVTSQTAPAWISAGRFSHVYFFASPPIARNIGRWSEPLFRQFTHMYVTAFCALVEHTLANRTRKDAPVHFLYPSSIFVTQPEVGFAEYAVAKAAGENLCDQLARRPGARFAKPRLPRLRTDQTSGLPDTAAADPFPVMLDVVRQLHSHLELDATRS